MGAFAPLFFLEKGQRNWVYGKMMGHCFFNTCYEIRPLLR